MSRYTGPAYRKSRRVGFSTLETGKDLARKPNKPGMHGAGRKGKPSGYSIQLQEKQKVRFIYGLNERQFKKTFDEAAKMKGIQGEDFLKLLETRLDNIVYRLGFVKTRRAARQMVNHGHITVNGNKLDIPSYRVKVGDIIGLKEKSSDHPIVKENLANVIRRVEFLTFNEAKCEGTLVRLPNRNELNPEINEALIVEFYNR